MKANIGFSGNLISDWIRLIFSTRERGRVLAASRFLHQLFWAGRYSQRESNFFDNISLELSPFAQFFQEYFVKNILTRFDTTIEEMEVYQRLNVYPAHHSMELFKKAEENLRSKIYVITPFDNIYPEELLILPNPPPILFAAGKIDHLIKRNPDKLGGVIGSRTPTHYGRKIARETARHLVDRGIGVISGLARGIDIIAQRTAIESGGYTVGVLGSGFLKIYPEEHYTDCVEIVRTGLLITEYSPDAYPRPENFPERNRIIAAFSKFLVVVEAKEKSGVFTTVESANLLGIDVWAVPGPIDSELSSGTNRLIAEGALALIDLKMLDVYPEN